MGALPRRIHGASIVRLARQACHPVIGDQDRLFPRLIATGDRPRNANSFAQQRAFVMSSRSASVTALR
jgi:hypothetical protein